MNHKKEEKSVFVSRDISPINNIAKCGYKREFFVK
jgi:hypothetical protein